MNEIKLRLYANIIFPVLILSCFFIGLSMKMDWFYTWSLIVMITLFKIELNTQWISEK